MKVLGVSKMEFADSCFKRAKIPGGGGGGGVGGGGVL